jgi:hypothetical protein
MAICNAYYKPQLLYRGQTAKYKAILSSGWRKLWLERDLLGKKLYETAYDFVDEGIDTHEFQKRLESIASRSQNQPTLFTFLSDPAGRDGVVSLLTHIRDSIGFGTREDIALYELERLERAFFARYQAYLFNNIPDPFISRFVPHTLRELARILLSFYDARHKSFDVEFRITQVGLDFMGILQHYGVLGTPGLDLTDDLDVALWFATHDGEKGYQQLPVEKWGVVFEVVAPVITFSPTPIDGQVQVNDLPAGVAFNLATISPLFPRITRQHGWYAIHGQAWESLFDYNSVFEVKDKRVVDYGTPQQIEERLRKRDLTAHYLFPSRDEDPFRNHLEQSGVST